MNVENLRRVGNNLRWARDAVYGHLVAGGALITTEALNLNGLFALSPKQEQALVAGMVFEVGALFVSLINVAYRDGEAAKEMKKFHSSL